MKHHSKETKNVSGSDHDFTIANEVCNGKTQKQRFSLLFVPLVEVAE